MAESIVIILFAGGIGLLVLALIMAIHKDKKSSINMEDIDTDDEDADDDFEIAEQSPRVVIMQEVPSVFDAFKGNKSK